MKRILSLLLMMAMLLPMALAEEGPHKGFDLMAENEHIALYVKKKPLVARVVDKATGQFADTNIMDGQKGNNSVKNLQKSLLNLSFVVNRKVGTVSAMDAYSLSVDLGTYTVEPVDQGVHIHFEVGDNTLTLDDLPKMIPVEKYKALVQPHLSSKDEKTFRDAYQQIGEDSWVRVKDDGVGALVIKTLHKILFEKAQYTKEDMQADNTAFGHVTKAENPHIACDLYLTLDGRDLVARFPLKDIAITREHDLQMVELLPYFLSAGTDDSGYMLVPDGPGGLIELNSGDITALSYLARVYGQDLLKDASRFQSKRSDVSLPVVGLRRGNMAAIAIIEKGADMAEITADISGRADEFNRASLRFVIRDIEAVSLVGNRSITVPRYAKDVYEGDLQVRYKLFFDDTTDYVGLAAAYRSYLIEHGLLKERAAEDKTPLFIEAIGAVRKQKFFLGIPYQSTVAASSLSQMATMYTALKGKGAQNVKWMVSGLLEGGVKHLSPTALRLEGSMGSLRDWEALRQQVNDRGDSLMPLVYLSTVYGKKRFNYYQDAARLHNGDAAKVITMSEAELRPKPMPYQSYYLSPQALPGHVKAAADALKGLKTNQLAVQDLGAMLVPDYARKRQISRNNALPSNEQALKALGEGYELALTRPHDYALPYARYALDTPLSGNGFKVVKHSVPFLPLVLQNAVTCVTPPINQAIEKPLKTRVMQAMEMLSVPSFSLSFNKETVFHNTQDPDVMGLFGTWYVDSLPLVMEVHAMYDAYYQAVREAKLLSHQILPGDVRLLTFDNGVTLILNYGRAPYPSDHGTVPGQDYLLWKE